MKPEDEKFYKPMPESEKQGGLPVTTQFGQGDTSYTIVGPIGMSRDGKPRKGTPEQWGKLHRLVVAPVHEIVVAKIAKEIAAKREGGRAAIIRHGLASEPEMR
jgi:hypothetical protein